MMFGIVYMPTPPRSTVLSVIWYAKPARARNLEFGIWNLECVRFAPGAVTFRRAAPPRGVRIPHSKFWLLNSLNGSCKSRRFVNRLDQLNAAAPFAAVAARSGSMRERMDEVGKHLAVRRRVRHDR